MAIQNLFRYRLPVMLFAGRAPFTLHGEVKGSRDTYVHFVQDSFDPASIVRPYVKWEYTLPSGVVVKEALARAAAFMHSDPLGPVYMMLPRETLAESWDEDAMPAYPPTRFGSVKAGGIEPARAAAVAEALMAAENPIALTAYLGRNADAVAALDRLAQACGMRIAEFNPVTVNIPQDSPCFAGSEPAALVANADLGLLIDTDVPFLPQALKAADALRWIQIDIDPLKADIPMWGFATDLRIQGDSAIILEQVLEIVEARADESYRAKVRRRIASWKPGREAAEARRRSAAEQKGEPGAINPAFLFARLRELLSDDDIVLNEAVRNAPVLQQQLRRTKPLTYVGLAGGGLGFSGGMALGLRLAHPSRRVVQIVGDGAFHFGAPDSVYAVSQQYRLPIFTVVLDNGGWQAVKSATQRVYPKGIAVETDAFQSRLMSGRQGERRDFSEVAKAFGAYGECAREPHELTAAIDRCLAALDDGKAAVLHVHVTRL
jgi:acetolactate synthase-1/2/3 large subunit